MNPLDLISKYYKDNPVAYEFLINHSTMVAQKAVSIAERVKHLNPDIRFIEEAALLHDIGIYLTNAPRLGITGDMPYICHGYLGRELLEKEGLPRHAIVCETHVGVGLSKEDIVNKRFPLPVRDMIPETLEEKIVCYADKFFSKDNNPLKEKSLDKAREMIRGYGNEKLVIFDEWVRLFGDG